MLQIKKYIGAFLILVGVLVASYYFLNLYTCIGFKFDFQCDLSADNLYNLRFLHTLITFGVGVITLGILIVKK